MCDMRRKLQYYEGVPDNVVDETTCKRVNIIKERLEGQKDN
jgi:hypothetical protein